MTLWGIATYDGFINPIPSVHSDGPLTNGALLLLWVGVLGSVMLVVYGHSLYRHDDDGMGVFLSTAPGIAAGFMADYLMRHYDSGWKSFWTFVLVVGVIGGSVVVQGLRLRGLGGISLGLAALVAGVGLVFDVANRVTAGVPISISGAIVLGIVVVCGMAVYASDNN